MWAVYSEEVRGEVGTRSCMCMLDGHCKRPKHVVDLYVVNSLSIYNNNIIIIIFIYYNWVVTR